MELKQRFNHWQRSQQGIENARQRVLFLTTAQIPPDPPGLFTPTRCKVLRAFYVSGKPALPGEIISLPWHDAESLAAINKCEIIQ